MENPENVLQELNQFEREPTECLPRQLEEYLQFVARTGNTVFPWHKIKLAVRTKLEAVIADFSLAMPEEQVRSRFVNHCSHSD
jgi:serine/threonine-protein phosphatase 4 regulatory subunit 2